MKDLWENDKRNEFEKKIVSYAASANVSTIKATCGLSGVLGRNVGLADPHLISRILSILPKSSGNCMIVISICNV